MTKPEPAGTLPGSAHAKRPDGTTPGRANHPSDTELGLEATPLPSDAAAISVLGDTMAPTPADLSPGQTPPLSGTGKFPVVGWGRYEFLQLLGKGGMGAVYKARDPRLDRMIALKFIHSTDDQMILRFMQEARAQARIDHPGICKILARSGGSDELASRARAVIPALIPRRAAPAAG